MTINTKKVLAALTLMSMGAVANAASVSLIPNTATSGLGVGGVLSMDIVIDFSAEGGTLGGGFDLTFDESAFELVSFTPTVILGDPAFGRPPDYVPGSGLLESWGVGDFGGLNTGLVGTVELAVRAGASSSFISLGPTSGIAGPWVSAVDFITIIEPDYNQVEYVVPVPAAVWFMLSGLGALVGFGRRKAA